MKLQFSTKFFFAAILLFMIEVAIAYFHFNDFIRGFLGDVLVTLFMYACIRIFIRNNVFKTALLVLAFAFFVEILQYFKLAELLNIQSKTLLIIIGSVFDVWDLVAYFIGFLFILFVERVFHKNTLWYFSKF